MGKQIEQKTPEQQSNHKRQDIQQANVTSNNQQVNQQSQQPNKDFSTFKKKIIKKVFQNKPKGQQTNNDQWKPKTIQQSKIDSQKGKQKLAKKTNIKIADTFLSALSKPLNETFDNPKFSFNDLQDQQPIKLPFQKLKNKTKQISPALLKNQQDDQNVDIDGQFIFKRPPTLQQIQKSLKGEVKQKIHGFDQLQKEEIQPEPQIVIIKGKNDSQKQVKIRQINLGKVIDKEWKQTNAILNSDKNINLRQYWNDSGLSEQMKGKMTVQAIQKYMDIEEQMNKRQFQKKKMKSRYGW